MPKWDERNRPIGYILSVTPGFARLGAGEERLIYMGLARKITRAARLGFDFAEIDFEALSEMHEPEIKKLVERVKKIQKMEVGLHLPVDMDLCLAQAYQWERMQEMLRKGTEAADMMKSKFILFHTSSMARPPVSAPAGERTMPAKLASPEGINLGAYIDREGLRDWFMAKFIEVLFRAMGVPGDISVITYFDEKVRLEKKGFKESAADAKKEWRDILLRYDKEIKNILLKGLRAQLEELERRPSTPEIESAKRRIEELIERIMVIPAPELVERSIEGIDEAIRGALVPKDLKRFRILLDVERYTERFHFDDVFDYWKLHGSEAEEYVAYHVVAKNMYIKKDPFWTSIVEDSRDPDEIVYESDKEMILTKAIKQLITAVAAKYIEGHLKTCAPHYAINLKTLGYSKENKYMSVFDFCVKQKIHIFLETNMPGGYEGGRGAPPGELRIIKATDHVKIVKVLGGEDVSYCMDFEHLLTNYVDPEKEAEELMKMQGGRWVRCLHINAPRPIVGAHGPIEMLSHDMYIIYRYLYKLRKAGVKNAYWIWEMGGYGISLSAIAFRRMKEALLKGIKPDDLPTEFFGIDHDFEARQLVAIREHAFDPLSGLLMIPEERHTFLSKAALEKGKAREWEREKYR